MLNLYMMLVFVNHLTKEEYLSQMTELTGKGVGWLLKTLLAAVVGFNAIQGMITPALDALKNTAFTRALRVLPGIGNVAGGSHRSAAGLRGPFEKRRRARLLCWFWL